VLARVLPKRPFLEAQSHVLGSKEQEQRKDVKNRMSSKMQSLIETLGIA